MHIEARLTFGVLLCFAELAESHKPDALAFHPIAVKLAVLCNVVRALGKSIPAIAGEHPVGFSEAEVWQARGLKQL